jgi:hypothetical protein
MVKCGEKASSIAKTVRAFEAEGIVPLDWKAIPPYILFQFVIQLRQAKQLDSDFKIRQVIFFPMARQTLGGLGLLIIEVLRSHSDTPHSVELLWMSDQPDA